MNIRNNSSTSRIVVRIQYMTLTVKRTVARITELWPKEVRREYPIALVTLIIHLMFVYKLPRRVIKKWLATRVNKELKLRL